MALKTVDWQSIAPALLRPGRPRLAEARAVVLGARSVREAWEALVVRALVPSPWGDEDVGAFRGRGALGVSASWQPSPVPLRAARNATSASAESRESPVPPSIDDAVALASDPDGIARASQLAGEFHARVRRWRPSLVAEACPPRVWFVVPAGGLDAPAIDLQRTALYLELIERFPVGRWSRAIADDIKVRTPWLADGARMRFTHDLLWATRWQMAVDRGLRQTTTGTPYEDLADPTGPLLDIWSLGYVLDLPDRDRIGLVAPGV